MENKVVTISNKYDFSRLYKRGRRWRFDDWLVIRLVPNQKGCFRWGLTIPRHVGTAVLRNRLRRWCKESIRTFVQESPANGWDVDIFFKKNKKQFYESLRFHDVHSALQKFSKSSFKEGR